MKNFKLKDPAFGPSRPTDFIRDCARAMSSGLKIQFGLILLGRSGIKKLMTITTGQHIITMHELKKMACLQGTAGDRDGYHCIDCKNPPPSGHSVSAVQRSVHSSLHYARYECTPSGRSLEDV